MKTLEKFEKGSLKIVGFIRFGAGIKPRTWIAEAKTAGYFVIIMDGGAGLYK